MRDTHKVRLRTSHVNAVEACGPAADNVLVWKSVPHTAEF